MLHIEELICQFSLRQSNTFRKDLNSGLWDILDKCITADKMVDLLYGKYVIFKKGNSNQKYFWFK